MANENIIKIKPSKSWLSLGFKEIWAYREVLYFMTWRDVKVRYKQTAIGVFWAILQPALTTLIFAIVFSQVAHFDSSGVPYPLFVLSGMLIWLFIYNSITFAANSLVGNANLVTKTYFPRLIVPLAAVFAGLIDLVLGLLILLGLMFYYSTAISIQILFAPFFMFLAVLLTLSFAILFSALNVRFRDVKFALPFFLQVWLFISPVFYPSGILSEKVRFIFSFNPLTGILNGFRASLFGDNFDQTAICISVAATLVLIFVALFVFKQMEDDFADLI